MSTQRIVERVMEGDDSSSRRHYRPIVSTQARSHSLAYWLRHTLRLVPSISVGLLPKMVGVKIRMVVSIAVTI